MSICTKSTNQGNFEGTCIGTYELSNSKQQKYIRRLVKYLVVLLSTIVKFAMFFNTDTGLKEVILHWSG